MLTKQFTYAFSKNALEELQREENYLQTLQTNSLEYKIEKEQFPQTEEEIKAVQHRYLEQGPGFCIVDGLQYTSLQRPALRGAFYVLGRFLGTPLIQNVQGDFLVEVRDRGQSMKTGGRYHNTREGGSLHTDSPQFPEPPDYLGLLCHHPAKNGGISRLINAEAIHTLLSEQHPDLLQVLYQPFHFDKRGDFKKGEAPTTFAPVFEVNDSDLRFRYLREYIDQGHQRVDVPLTEKQRSALEKVDLLLEDQRLVVETDMQTGQILLNKNNKVAHGRTSFEDWPEEERKRIMLRLWIRKGKVE